MRSTADLDLPLHLTPEDPRPLSVQLAAALRDSVRSGLLRPGDRLPPTRLLAQRLKVSRGTVTAAFDQLDGEGYLQSAQGSGTYINSDLAPSGGPAPAPPLVVDSGARPRKTLDLTPGQPDTRRLVDSAWRAAWKLAADSPPRGAYPPDAGLDLLRHNVVEHLRVARGLSVESADVMITAGTREGLALLLQALARRSTGPLVVAVEEPGYPAARRVLTEMGARVINVAVDADGLVVTDLPIGRSAPAVVFATPSHQYPLGGRLPVSRRLALLEWARLHHAIIVEDDYDSEFRHTGAPLPAMAALDDGLASVVHLGTFSKTVTPWVRTGYLAAGPDLMTELMDVRHALGNPVPGSTQVAMAHYLGSGALRRHIARTRRDYRHRRELLIRMLADSKHIHPRGLDGGLHVVLDLPAGTDVPGLLATAEADHGLLVADLDHYYAGTAPGPGIVLGYGGATDTELKTALQIIIDLVDKAQP